MIYLHFSKMTFIWTTMTMRFSIKNPIKCLNTLFAFLKFFEKCAILCNFDKPRLLTLMCILQANHCVDEINWVTVHSFKELLMSYLIFPTLFLTKNLFGILGWNLIILFISFGKRYDHMIMIICIFEKRLIKEYHR